MPTPPVGGVVMTPDELGRLTGRWTTVWGDRIPSASRLGVHHGDPGVTVRLLPVGHNYPATVDELRRLMARYGAMLAVLAENSAGILLITHGWQQHDPQGRPGRDEFLASLTPSAIHWRTDDRAVEPGFQSHIHSFVQRLPMIRGAMPVVEMHAVDSTDDVLIVDEGLRWTAVLRNGGLDVLSDDSELLDRLIRYGSPMTTRGIVRVWHDEQGWGVIDSPATPGGCWAHISAVAIAGYRSLSPGRPVLLEWETTLDQDGYQFVATRTWPVGTDPVDVTPGAPADAYRSTLTITFDRDPESTDSRSD